ncbi:MAG: NAD-dependent epimerase/dehydratase family protein [Candidatus Brennerbacteria bacterium]|nr:NAD-dependent epimerase/dehydratase family protein [Candidatus Brennerbacteria bacterium]
MAKILITGGAGFIASHITDKYINLGHRAVIIDNLATGFRRNINKKAKFYKADIRDKNAVEKIFKKERPEIVNHHAAIAEVVKSLRDPIPTYQTNVLGTANVLVAGGLVKIKKFIFSSTGGAIYGQPDKIPADEKTPAIPLSPYGLSKLLGEEMIKFYSRVYGFNYLIFRYPNVYGPRQNPKGEAGVVAIFGGLMKSGLQPKIYGNGTKTRDYVYIDDIVNANIITLKKCVNEIINLGSGQETSDKKIFNLTAKAVNFQGKPVFSPARKGEVYRIAISGEKAQKKLGWKAKTDVETGIKKTIEKL